MKSMSFTTLTQSIWNHRVSRLPLVKIGYVRPAAAGMSVSKGWEARRAAPVCPLTTGCRHLIFFRNGRPSNGLRGENV